MNKALEINTVSVSIRLLEVDGKKMTKAVFSQIQEKYPFSPEFEYLGGDILGYVVDSKHRHLLYVQHGEMRKCDISPAGWFVHAGMADMAYQAEAFLAQHGFYPSRPIRYGDTIAECYRKDYAPKFDALRDKVKGFLAQLEGKQLYIAI